MSPTGNKKNSRREARRGQAFTLVELLLVMTLLVVVIAVAAPTLANFFRGRTLDSEAMRLLALTRHGQSRAVSEGIPMALWLDTERRTYGLEQAAGFTDWDTNAVEFTLDKELRMETVRRSPAQTTGTSASLNRGTYTGSRSSANRLVLSPLASHRNLPTIGFLADGSITESSPAAVRLLGRDDACLWVAQTRNRLSYEIRGPTNEFIAAGK